MAHPNPPAPPAPPADPPPAPANPPANPTPPPADPGNGGEPKTYDEAYVKRLRDEAAENRTKLSALEKQQQTDSATMEKLRKALGIDEGKDADPEALQKTISDHETEIRKLRIGTLLGDVFSDVGVKPKLARALLNDGNMLDGIDPTADGADSKLKGIVEKLLADNPEIGTTQSPAGSSGPPNHEGAGGGKRQLTDSDIEKMSDAEIVKAMDEGLLDNLLKGR